MGILIKIRYTQAYYDEETGWYYTGRYYDPYGIRYVDGIAPELVESLIDKYGYKACFKSYGFWLPYTGGTLARQAVRFTTTEVVGRVIYTEAGTLNHDWRAVAWVIYNRMSAWNMNAYDVVTQAGEFEAYSNGDYAKIDDNYNQAKMSVCMESAELLCNGKAPSSSVDYITSQKHFRAIDTLLAGYDSDGVAQYYNGVVIKNVVVPGSYVIHSSKFLSDLTHLSIQHGVFNIYFSYYYE